MRLLTNVFFSMVLTFILLNIYGNNPGINIPNMSILQEKVALEKNISPYRNRGDGTFYDGANFIQLTPQKTIKILKADIVDSRFETLLAITVLGYAVAGLLIFAGILYNRKSPQIPYFCAFYLVFSILFLYTVSDHRLSLLNQDVVSKDFVMKNVEKLLDLQNNAEKTQIINLENTSVFIGKKEQFGIDFARLTGKNEIFFYVGNDLDMQKLSSYNGYVDWEKIDDTIFCCQYKQTYHYLSKVRLRVKVIRCLFYVIILFICGTMFFLLQEEIWRT